MSNGQDWVVWSNIDGNAPRLSGDDCTMIYTLSSKPRSSGIECAGVIGRIEPKLFILVEVASEGYWKVLPCC